MGLRFKFDVDIDSLNAKRFETVVAVGYPSDAIHHSGESAANLAKLLTEGTDTIPPRPHLQEGLEHGMEDIKKAVKQYARGLFGVFGNKKGHPEIIAEVARKAVINYIYSGNLEPNAPSTVARKGFDQPLVDEHDLIQMLEGRIIKR
jgi:hypothetical protein